MDPADIDSGSLPAVKSLRSKFEQLAVDTAHNTPRPSSSTGDLLHVDTPSPRVRRPSGSHLDFSPSQTHLRSSSSSSDLKVGTKRPPPPPPPRIAKPHPSPKSSRSPSPLPSAMHHTVKGEHEIPQDITTLKSLLWVLSLQCLLFCSTFKSVIHLPVIINHWIQVSCLSQSSRRDLHYHLGLTNMKIRTIFPHHLLIRIPRHQFLSLLRPHIIVHHHHLQDLRALVPSQTQIRPTQHLTCKYLNHDYNSFSFE
jgi:hypothetical protein